MFKKTRLNKKGFTLVELLAVIVVLAIIMVIAIPSVMDSMQNARQGAFKIQAEKVLNKAQEKYSTDLLMNSLPTGISGAAGNPSTSVRFTGTYNSTSYTVYCYTISHLGLSSNDTYKGYVIMLINSSAELKQSYVTMTDASFSVTKETYSRFNSTGTGTYDKAVFNTPNTTANTCPTASTGWTYPSYGLE